MAVAAGARRRRTGPDAETAGTVCGVVDGPDWCSARPAICLGP